MTRSPLPHRVRKTAVTNGVHLAEDVLARYRIVAERLLEHLEGAEREALKNEARLTHLQVTGAIREIGEETYSDGKAE